MRSPPFAPFFLTLLLACGSEGPAAEEPDTSDMASENDVHSDAAQTQDVAADVWEDGYWLPTAMKDLYGMWANEDGANVRLFEFLDQEIYLDYADMVGVSPVYHLYVYPLGASPVLLERGRVIMKLGGHLELETRWSSEGPTKVGQKTPLTLIPAPKGTFALDSVSGTPRVYTKSATFP